MALLYPDLLNLHGDRANMLAFQRTAATIGVPLQAERIDAPETPIDFSRYDILLLPPGETVETRFLVSALTPQREGFARYIEDGGILLVVGTSIAIFGKHTGRKRGDSFEGLGLVDVTCVELRTAYSNDAVLKTETFGTPMEIVGGQIQMLRVRLGEGVTALGTADYGYGNDGGGGEGLRHQNFFFTNLLGPVFVKNPWFAEAILRLACQRKGIHLAVESPDYALERQSNQEIRRFIDLKIEKHDKTRLYNGED
jgi:CobQ-like glutamine amidotransferase family enzyme